MGLKSLENEAVQVLDQLVEIHNLPLWMQKEAHILRGYRPEFRSFRRCYHSLFYIHNETVNIWSHLLTGTGFLFFLAWTAAPEYYGGFSFADGDLRGVQFFLLAATPETNIFDIVQASYHCLSCHSEHVANQCLKLDLLGIVTGTTGTTIIFVGLGASGYFPILHAALSDRLTLDNFSLPHLTVTTLAFSLGTGLYVGRIPESWRPGKFDIWVS
ncbi:hypothetical protein B0T16DRAFT_392359 [Cercophora newfieldiana]|uniref:Uncharacterized protein n=1 Tax=Cercophora newfieldiana TaxID=92897 RepID=A0AA39Y0Z9_9PEZI|nr:hypothetical protein B0T16DRAFT_392359 [Cercophora newfieldiana]